MQSSSLIFVVVVAIWAAYLVQYWVRRRDHLATIRSVDRFSAAMRVLDSHRLSQTAEPARSYAVSPARAASPQVVVKRGAATPEVEMTQQTAPEKGAGRSRLVSAVVDAPRKYRGIAFLTHLVLLPVAFLVAAFGQLPWLVPGLLLPGLVGSFGWLRQDVKAAEAARRAKHLARRRAREAAAPGRRAAPARRPAPQPAAQVEDVEEPAAEADAPFDVADEAPAVPAEVPTPEPTVAEELPGTWEPVPVPRPTYTMKARADARPDPAAPVESADVPQVLDAVEDDDVVSPSPRAVGS